MLRRTCHLQTYSWLKCAPKLVKLLWFYHYTLCRTVTLFPKTPSFHLWLLCKVHASPDSSLHLYIDTFFCTQAGKLCSKCSCILGVIHLIVLRLNLHHAFQYIQIMQLRELGVQISFTIIWSLEDDNLMKFIFLVWSNFENEVIIAKTHKNDLL